MRVGWLFVVAACGRIGFDPCDAVSVGSDAGPPTSPLVRVTTAQGAPMSNTIDLTTTIDANHLVIVGFSIYEASTNVLQLTAGTNTFVSAGGRATVTGGSTEIWYVANTAAVSGRVRAVLNTTVSGGMWVAEFAIANPSPVVTTAAQNDGSASGTVTGAPLVANANDLVFSVASLTGTNATGLVAGDPFADLPAIGGDPAAYLIAPTPGTYAPTWTLTGGSPFAATTASFALGP